MTDTWRIKMSQRAMSIDNISFLSPPMSSQMQYDYEKEADFNDMKDDMSEMMPQTNDGYGEQHEQTKYNMEDDENDEENNIIPWKKLLRKTNSRLNLIT